MALPNTATAQELFNSCAAHGGKAWDHSAMVRALEMMADFEIGGHRQAAPADTRGGPRRPGGTGRSGPGRRPAHPAGTTMRRTRNAKIVATLGPASSSPEAIRALFEAGADVFRPNFSHGSHPDHQARLGAIRGIERETGRPIGVLADLQGPK